MMILDHREKLNGVFLDNKKEQACLKSVNTSDKQEEKGHHNYMKIKTF